MKRIFKLVFIFVISLNFIGCSIGEQKLINNSLGNNIEKNNNINKVRKEHRQVDKIYNKKGK